MGLTNAITELYRKAATELPNDITLALKNSLNNEDNNAKNILNDILKNIELAKQQQKPICQDTGTPIFYVNYNRKFSQKELRGSIIEATKQATKIVPLRPNAVDPLTGKNSGDNTGINIPVIHFNEWNKDFLEISLMLKGGGSENISQEYKLPNSSLQAGRDINGIKKCIIDAMFKAQGKGCSPNIIGVGIGGTKDVAISLAKKQLLRKLDDKNNDEQLMEIENDMLDKVNKLGIGPIGLGGKTTALDVKIAKQHRHPASFFIAVSFMCWACRRKTLIFREKGFEIE